jgi:DNA-binding MarR family transcriptional regulator
VPTQYCMRAHVFVRKDIGYPSAMADERAGDTVVATTQLGFDALFAIAHVQSHAVRLIDDALARAHTANLTGYELLKRLATLHPDGASVRYLSDQVLLSPSRVSRVVDEFVTRGLLERAASPHDGRLSLVRLTDGGRAELEAMDATFERALEAHFLDRLSVEQVQTLIDIGHRLGAPHCDGSHE